jgi:predicted alpha/beta hydrolase
MHLEPSSASGHPTRTSWSIPARDGVPLAADGFGLERGAPIAIVAGATGVPRAYYRRFASHLAAHGFGVLTFDYRGIAGSASEEVNGRATMAAWGEEDMSGVIAWIRERYAPRTLSVVGHSVGGQILPLADGATEIDAIYLVAAQSGYWRLWEGTQRATTWLYWHAVIPLTLRVAGRLPSRVIGGGEDVPLGVAEQWARWGRSPDYILSHSPEVAARFASIVAPVRAIHFDDDFFAPPRAVNELLSFYRRADKSARVVCASDLGVRSIGHFGFFRERPGRPLWDDTVEFLRGNAA